MDSVSHPWLEARVEFGGMVFPLKAPAERYHLGPLCRNGHRWPGTDLSLRRNNEAFAQCRVCATGRKDDRHWWLPFVGWPQSPLPANRKLGKLCKHGHSWMGTDLSLRHSFGHGSGQCAECQLIRGRDTEKHRARKRRWAAANPDKTREAWTAKKHTRRANNKSTLVRLSPGQRDRIFAIWKGRCAYCSVLLIKKAPLGHPMTKTTDHVLPVSKGGLDEAGNIIPACLTCNSKRGNRPLEEWFRSQPFFTEAALAKIKRHTTTTNGQLSLVAA